MRRWGVIQFLPPRIELVHQSLQLREAGSPDYFSPRFLTQPVREWVGVRIFKGNSPSEQEPPDNIINFTPTTCSDTTCSDATCSDATCSDTTCSAATCSDATCSDAACSDTTCSDKACSDTACSDKLNKHCSAEKTERTRDQI